MRANICLSPTAVLRESKSYLTDYELEEVKGYKEVWFLGEKAHKSRYSNKDKKSTNFGYDNEEGFYRVVSTKLFTVQRDNI